jgi:four helix bundle protein
MPKYERFEDVPVWKKAAKLYNHVLDLLEDRRVPLSRVFQNQLERAALSVSNNIAEGFERVTTNELISFLAIARGSAGEVRSMIAVVIHRSGIGPYKELLEEIRQAAESCCKQITAWIGSIEMSPVQGKRHKDGETRRKEEWLEKGRAFRREFLRNLKPDHPLYKTNEAREARGEPPEQGR